MAPNNSAFENVIYEVANEVATITLNRPAKINALSDQLMAELLAALERADLDDEVRVVVLTGAGGNFSSGFDIRGGSAYSKTGEPLSYYLTVIRNMRKSYQAIWNNRKPVIAKIRGNCLAGGCYLQMLCDISYAADDAVFGHPAIVSGGVSGMPMWNWHLGTRRAKELLLTGRIIDAAEAERIGLVGHTVPADQLDREVEVVIQHLLRVPRDGLDLTKEALNTAADIIGLSATFRTQGHINALARFGSEINLDLAELRRQTKAETDALTL
jgi:enoyl-CoA hydratase